MLVSTISVIPFTAGHSISITPYVRLEMETSSVSLNCVSFLDSEEKVSCDFSVPVCYIVSITAGFFCFTKVRVVACLLFYLCGASFLHHG